MGFFQTKDPKSGEPRLGAGVYLIICALMIGGVVLWNVRQHAQDPRFVKDQMAAEHVAVNPNKISATAKAAEAHQETVDSSTPPGVAREATSTRGVDLTDDINSTEDTSAPAKVETDNLDTIQNTVDLLRQSQEKIEREKAEAVAREKADADAKIAKLKHDALSTNVQPDSHAGTPAPDEQHNEINTSSLVIYDSHSAQAQAQAQAEAKTEAAKEAAAAARISGFQTKDFLPRGYFFPVYLLSTVQTVNQEDMVIMGVAENVIFQHKVQIPFGTRLLGTAAASNFEDRVMINVDTILYPDGRELPISAFLKDASDLASGVKGYYIPQPFNVQIAPFVAQFVETWTQAAADRFSRNNQNNSDSNSGGQVYRSSLDQTSSLIDEQARKIQQKLDRRFPEKVVIPIGTKAYAQIRSPLDLTQARVAGSLGNKQPVLPGFENNPIAPNGSVEKSANYGVNTRATTGQLTSAPANPTAAAINQATAQEAGAYINALSQLNALEKKLDARQNTPRGSPPSSKVNWPQGDIQ